MKKIMRPSTSNSKNLEIGANFEGAIMNPFPTQ